MNDYEYKQVIVIRKDLNMRKGKMCAQAAHASLSLVMREQNSKKHGTDIRDWFESGQAKIVVSVDSEQEILDLKASAGLSGLPVALITDSGYTEFKGVPTITALAIGPALKSKIDKVTSHLKLL
jgi:PTH2 family peptidyl-tRNA hydrolase